MTGWSSLRSIARIYVAFVIAIGASLLVLRFPAARFEEPLAFWALLVGAVVLSASKVHLPVAYGSATLSMSYFTDFLALVLLGADAGMLISGAAGATQCLILTRQKPRVSQALFSAATLIISMQVTGLVDRLMGGFQPDWSLLSTALVTVGMADVFFLVNSVLVATAVALSRNEPIGRTWYESFFWMAPACFIGAGIAVLLVRVLSGYVWVPVLVAGPLYVTIEAYRMYFRRLEDQQQHLKEVSELHLASVEALARAIDARDQTIDSARSDDNHLRRVQAWATALAGAAGMSPPAIEAVKVAALLHDIGKLAVPEHILTKPGRLTSKEFERVRIHPIVGAEIIKAVPFPYAVAPIIRSHHERWDGSGYPDGLRADDIPLGARLLAVVDYFDAISSARPYHAAATRDEAIAAIEAQAGRALDPQLVALFLRILPSLASADTNASGAQVWAPVVGEGDVAVARRLEEPGLPTTSSVFHDISLATQEMRALHDIAQTLGTRLTVDDTMALLTSKLKRLVPVSCWALFLHDAADDTLRCRFATGLAADTVLKLVIPAGAGPSGWVARHGTPLLNARADTDFEAAGLASGGPFRSALSYPLVDGDELIGTLTVYHVDAEPFRAEHQHVLDHISGQAASVLRNALAFERLRDVSFTDPLTHLPNSRALTDFVSQRVARGAADSEPIALIMIDVDRFKTVNDRLGHQAGDAALQAVAAAIRGHVRESDFCARYGGDEFIAVLCRCDRAEAERRARNLQYAVGRLQLETSSGLPLRVGISVGVSVFPEDGLTIDHLIATADHRMYEDKSRRRSSGTTAGPGSPRDGEAVPH